jgi:hypothetical protein
MGTDRQRQEEPLREASERRVRAGFGMMALSSVLLGLFLYLFQDDLGISADTARLISSVFLIAGIADTLVLYFWDRIFKRVP